jgi:hypothetical protein
LGGRSATRTDDTGVRRRIDPRPNAIISPAWIGGGPTTAMPDLGLTDAEIAAIVDYLLATSD